MSDTVIYFDGCTTYGHAGGTVQVELQTNMLDPMPSGGVEVRSEVTARLRCSAAGAQQLIEALQRAVAMVNEPSSGTDPVKN